MKKSLFFALCTAAVCAAHAESIDSTVKPAYSGVAIGTYEASTSTADIAITDQDGNAFTVDANRRFAVVYTLNPAALQQAMSETSDVALATIENNRMNWTLAVTSTGITFKTAAYGAVATTADHWDVNVNSGYPSVNISTGLSSIDWTTITRAALTMSYYDSGTQLLLTLEDENGGYTSYAGENTSFRATGGNNYAPTELTVNGDIIYSAYVYDNTSLDTDANRIALSKQAMALVPAVPEPATATLSLLALAGLAARRRRK